MSLPYWSVVQLTDIHLHADPAEGLYGLNSLDCFSQVVSQAQQRQPDIALLTGDLVHDETSAGYRLLATAITKLNSDIYCIPGNHDDAALMRQELCVPMTTSGCHAITHGQWQIILLNSQKTGEVAGCLAPSVLAFLEQRLNQHSDKYTMVCLHHHPVDIGSKWLDQIGLDNADDFFAVLDHHSQVKAVVWGHIHQAFEQQRNGVRLLATPSTCIQFKPQADDFALDDSAAGYRWFRLYENGAMETAVERLAAMPGKLDKAAAGY